MVVSLVDCRADHWVARKADCLVDKKVSMWAVLMVEMKVEATVAN